ncbi:MAG: DUF4065 domain-containing protein [Magnetococcales bacterium]|nr:DUF4065 domain-containing protein [Magnetococcales bacterium]MBF0113728.1 DUF4065 domain-containing protein [Magnetococcales bacterium]
MATVFDVSAYILEKQGAITAMKLQKLVYYAQAWSLVWDEVPLFNEKIEAWINGPVVRELFEAHQGQFKVSRDSFVHANPNALTSSERETVDSVLQHYGEKSSQYLSDLTHMEEPWRNARKGMPDDERGNREITHEAMFNYYSSLPPEAEIRL